MRLPSRFFTNWAGLVRPDQDRIGGKPEEVVEADETCVGGRTRGKEHSGYDRGVGPCQNLSAQVCQ